MSMRYLRRIPIVYILSILIALAVGALLGLSTTFLYITVAYFAR